MLVYWLLFIFSSSLAIADFISANKLKRLLPLVAICCFFVIGFRWEVGCDWLAYLFKFEQAQWVMNYSEWEFVSTDIGYAFINIFSARIESNIITVNALIAAIGLIGLMAFCKQQPNPLLGMSVAIPYIVIVFFQGYTRQAGAFGFELLALTFLSSKRRMAFVICILCAASFHKTALLILPIAALASTQNKWWTYLWVGITFVTAFSFFLAEHQDTLWESYVVSHMESSGGGIRIAMNIFPALLLLMIKHKFSYQSLEEKKLWFWFAILAIACFLLVSFSTTAADRIGLYLMPLQIYTFCRLPEIFPQFKGLLIVLIIAFYATVQAVWLNYATHAFCWLPYKNYLFL